jgi:aldose sugar dehydrogenase
MENTRKRTILTYSIASFAIIILVFSLLSNGIHNFNNGVKNNAVNPSYQRNLHNSLLPEVRDNMLKVELVAQGLVVPTSMAFVDKNDILVTGQNGTISLVTVGDLRPKPVRFLQQVISRGQDGLLGIATTYHAVNTTNSNTGDNRNIPSVFLYLTEIDPYTKEYRNRVYAYHWINGILTDKRVILDLPGSPFFQNVGGKLAIGPDDKLYAVIGDLSYKLGVLQNIANGPKSDNTSSIIRVNLDGQPPNDNPFSYNSTMRYIFAYGIRNGFGLGFDPITGNLWDTENGPNRYDEMNIVKPGFNSGWAVVMGPISKNSFFHNVTVNSLVNFPRSHYTDPVFSWYQSVAPTAIEFMKSSKLGEKYKNNIFVGGYNKGDLYYFEVNQTRTGIKFGNVQTGHYVADNSGKISEITFGTGFDRITDIKTGPDGLLYILSYGDGNIYRIVPR